MKRIKKVTALILSISMIISIMPYVTLKPVKAARTNEQIVFEYLINELKVNVATACGIMGNMQQEAYGFDPTRTQNSDGTGGYGICQWDDRKAALRIYAKEQKKSMSSLQLQLEFMKHELSDSENKAWSEMQNIDNTRAGVEIATRNWCTYYERAGTPVMEKRIKYALEFWDKYGKTIKISSISVENIKNTSATIRAGLDAKATVTKWGIFYGTSKKEIKNIDVGTKHSSSKDRYKYSLLAEYGSGKIMKSFSFNTQTRTTVANRRIKLESNRKYYYKMVCKVDGKWIISSLGTFKTANEAPSKVTGMSLSSKNLAKRDTTTVTWNKSGDADSYVVRVEKPDGKTVTLSDKVTGTTYKIDSKYTGTEGKYTVNVYARNDAASLSKAAAKSYRVHPDVKVTFKTETKIVAVYTIGYNKTTPVPNMKDDKAKKHDGWKVEGDTKNRLVTDFSGIKKDTTFIQAASDQEYTVKYVDSYTGEQIGSAPYRYETELDEKDYPEAPEHSNYVFAGWSQPSLKVTGDCSVNAIYEWNNKNQVIAEIESIERAKSKAGNEDNDGYNVTVRLTIPSAAANDNTVKGRVMVALKTEAGRLLIETESAAFVMYPKSRESTKTIEVFVPYEATDEALAYSAEVYVINDYEAGGMIAAPVVDTEKMKAANLNEIRYTTNPAALGTSAVRVTEKDYTLYSWTNKTTTVKQDLSSMLSGYTCTGNSWVQVSSGTVNYVKNWPELGSGLGARFNNKSGTGKTLYNTYNKTPKSASESTNSKVTTSESVLGYIYYHWCRNRDNGSYKHWTGAKNHVSSSGIKYNMFHAMYLPAASRLSLISVPDVFGDTQVYQKKAGECTESKYWRKQLTVYRQNWKQYTKRYTHTKTVTTTGRTKNKSDVPTDLSNTTYDTSKPVSLATTVSNKVTTVSQKYYAYRSASATAHEDRNKYDLKGTVGKAYAGEKVVVYVYKDVKMSDYTTEYIGTATVDGNGEIKITGAQLREKCTIETGDFTIAAAVQQETDAIVIGTIEAPKPVYTVTYVADIDGKTRTIGVQKNVEEGSAAAEPGQELIPEKEGYHFAGWSQSSNSVYNDMTIEAVYEEDTYKVVYVDWANQTVDMEDYAYGESPELPQLPETEEGINVEWVVGDGTVEEPQTLEEFINEGNVVTGDMVISTKYTLQTYTVTVVQPDMETNVADFINPYNYDSIDYVVDGRDTDNDSDETIRVSACLEQAEHGDVLQLDGYEEEAQADGDMIITGWADAATGELIDDIEVKDNMTIYPVYTFAETTETPYADVKTGEYNSEQTVTLSTDTEDGVIYYTTDGSDPRTSRTSKEYKGAITLTQSTELKYYACSLGRNDSEVAANLYAVNTTATKDIYHVVTLEPLNIIKGDTDCNVYMLVKEGEALEKDSLPEIDGYDLSGVYADYKRIEPFDISKNTITSSIVLYINYTNSIHSVKFMKGDTLIEEQMVEYSGAAIAPKMEEIEGYKFAGWNQDFECVTDDMTVYAKYISEEEYATVSLSRTNVAILVGNQMNLVASIYPTDLTNEEIEWYSSDEDVIEVDKGTVYAVGEGTAYVTVKVISSGECSICNFVVTRNPDSQLVLKKNASMKFDYSGYSYINDLSDKTVGGILKQFENENVIVVNQNDEQLSSETIIGSGCKVVLEDNETLLDECHLILTGDINGDGEISNKDITTLSRYILNLEEISYAQQLAGDVNGDGHINNRDVSMLARYLVGKEEL